MKKYYKIIVEIRFGFKKPYIVNRSYFNGKYKEYGIVLLFLKFCLGIIITGGER